MNAKVNNDHVTHEDRENAAEAFERVVEQANKAHRREINKKLKDVQLQIDQTRVEFGEIAIEQRVSTVLGADRLPYPVTVSEHKHKVILMWSAEGALYTASIALLSGQLFTTLDLDRGIIICMIALVFLLMAVVLPLLITVLFKVSPKDVESKEPVEKIFFVSLGIGLLAFIAFSMTRATPDIDGVWALIYTASLPITELMAAIAAACCSVLRKYFSWSLALSRKFRDLDSQADKLRNKLSGLNRNDDDDDDDDLILKTHLDG